MIAPADARFAGCAYVINAEAFHWLRTNRSDLNKMMLSREGFSDRASPWVAR